MEEHGSSPARRPMRCRLSVTWRREAHTVAQFTGVCAEASHECVCLVDQRSVSEFIRAEMLSCLGGLSVAIALALVPGPAEALKEGDCEGRSGS